MEFVSYSIMAMWPMCGRYTVGSEISNPSWSSSSWMRGAPQVGFSVFMRRINCRISALIVGRPRRRSRDRHRQNSRKPERCQETTVSGLTMISAPAQPGHNRRSTIQKSGSRAIQLRTRLLALKHGKLLAKGSGFQSEIVTRQKEGTEVGDHRTGKSEHLSRY